MTSEHHGGRGRAPAGEFGGEADSAGVRRDTAVDACGFGGGGKASADRAGRERNHAIARVGCGGIPKRAQGQRNPILDKPEIGGVTGRVRFRGADANE